MVSHTFLSNNNGENDFEENTKLDNRMTIGFQVHYLQKFSTRIYYSKSSLIKKYII